MAYQRQVFTRKCVFTIPNTAYLPSAIRYQHIRRIHQLDTTYQPFHSEQRIDFYSLNGVSVLTNNTAYSVNSIKMTEQNDYISFTRKNCISNDSDGRMIKRNFVEIQGAFLVKIRDNTFNGAIGENVFEHINKFLEVVGQIKINGVTQDQFKLSIFPILLAGAVGEWFKKDCIGSVTTWDDLVEKFVQKFYQLSDHNEEIEEDDDPDDITDIFKIEGNLFDFETLLCKAFNDFNYILKIDKDLFTFDIQGTGTYKEYESNNLVTMNLEEPWLDKGVPYQLCDHICEPYRFKNGVTKWPICSSDIDGFCNGGEIPGMVQVGSMTYFQDQKWYDELADRKLKEETLMYKAKVKESWGNTTPGVMKFCAWLINSFGNFHELDYNVLVKLQECWNYDTNNTGNTQDNQGHEERRDDPTLEQSVCKIRRFEMMKYSFNADEEYIAIKESEYLNHSKDNLDAYRELLRIIDEGWVMGTPDEE
ncbi:hypothetical protein Tco_1107132 [Tanacetum coccineum]